MKNMYLLTVLLAGTFLSSPAFAGDYRVTVDQLNSASDRFVFSKITDMAGTTVVSEPWNGTDSIELVDYNNPYAIRMFDFTYTPPADYELIEESGNISDYDLNDVTVHNLYFSNSADHFDQNISGDFINIDMLYNGGNLGNISGNFVNWVIEQYNSGKQLVSMGDISGNFITGYGIHNSNHGSQWGERAVIGNITADLVAGNNIFLYNRNGTVGDISVNTAINNVADEGRGGFIYNEGLEGYFYRDQYEYRGEPEFADDGRISNPEKYSAQIGNISGNIIGNMALGPWFAAGGAIFNAFGQIGDISADFLGNYAAYFYYDEPLPLKATTKLVVDEYSHPQFAGGAITNYNGKIGTITGNFKDNFAEGPGIAAGGAIYNQVFLESDTQPIVQDYAGPNDAETKNAVLLMDVYAERMNIEGSTFDGNYAHSTEANAYGGAIDNEFFFQNRVSEWEGYLNYESEYLERGYVYMTDEELQQKVIDAKANAALTLTNANFINNHADSDSGRAFGGAIYSTGDVNVIAKDGKTSLFKGNTANGENNAIYMKYSFSTYDYIRDTAPDENEIIYSNLNLSATDKGVIQFDDVIDGDGYNINVSGDGTGV
ncbi:MAG: hypothetical protein Q4D11_06350, partial [Rhodospirillales bacterium]|nr:hypothetical protein [Rhodospirillales bacterium]